MTENLKITCKCPKGRVKKTLKTFKRYFISLRVKNKPRTIIIDDCTFALLFEDVSEKARKLLVARAFRADIGIKMFYKVIIRLGGRANKLIAKGRKLTSVRNWFKKQGEKHGLETEQFEKMSDQEFTDFLQFDDKEEMLELLKGDLVDIALYEVGKE